MVRKYRAHQSEYIVYCLAIFKQYNLYFVAHQTIFCSKCAAAIVPATAQFPPRNDYTTHCRILCTQLLRRSNSFASFQRFMPISERYSWRWSAYICQPTIYIVHAIPFRLVLFRFQCEGTVVSRRKFIAAAININRTKYNIHLGIVQLFSLIVILVDVHRYVTKKMHTINHSMNSRLCSVYVCVPLPPHGMWYR